MNISKEQKEFIINGLSILSKKYKISPTKITNLIEELANNSGTNFKLIFDNLLNGSLVIKNGEIEKNQLAVKDRNPLTGRQKRTERRKNQRAKNKK